MNLSFVNLTDSLGVHTKGSTLLLCVRTIYAKSTLILSSRIVFTSAQPSLYKTSQNAAAVIFSEDYSFEFRRSMRSCHKVTLPVYRCLFGYFLVTIRTAKCLTKNNKLFRCEVMSDSEHKLCSITHHFLTCIAFAQPA